MQGQQVVVPKKYWAFISYSSKDRKWGRWLHRRLENYPIPIQCRGLRLSDGTVLGKNLRPIFRDREELAGSAELGPAIQMGLKQSRYLIVLCSKNSARSVWVNREIETFQSLGGERSILALIVDGVPNATSSAAHMDTEECFPPALRYPAEPLAGDLRKEGDGKDRGFLKILAGMAQLDFDAIYRRHERAQQKRRLQLSALASVIILVLAALGFYAFLKKNEAEQARGTAEASAQAEREAKETAEGLLIQTYVDAAELAVARADWKGARPVIEKALEHRPDDPRLRLMHLDALWGTGEVERATALFEELAASELPPEVEGRVKLREGMLLRDLYSEEGRALIERALQFPLDPDEKEMALALLADDIGESIAHARKAQVLNPFNNLVYPLLVYKLMSVGRLSEAERYVDGWSVILPKNHERRVMEAFIVLSRDPEQSVQILDEEFPDLEERQREILGIMFEMQALLARFVIRDQGVPPAQARQGMPKPMELASLVQRFGTFDHSVASHVAEERDLEIGFSQLVGPSSQPLLDLAFSVVTGNGSVMEAKAEEILDKHPAAFAYYVRGLARLRAKEFEKADEDFRLALECPTSFPFDVRRVALEGRIMARIESDPGEAEPEEVQLTRELCLTYLTTQGPLPVLTSLDAGKWLNEAGDDPAVLLVLQAALEEDLTRSKAIEVKMEHAFRTESPEKAGRIAEGILKEDPENVAAKLMRKRLEEE